MNINTPHWHIQDANIPKVNYARFNPNEKPFKIMKGEIANTYGVNTYIPIVRDRKEGNAYRWERHMESLIPLESDRKIIYDFLAHVVQYPGYKIRWSPLRQSTEGAGKAIIEESLQKVLGEIYTHVPRADKLKESGSSFNAWVRNKLLIIVNEINMKMNNGKALIEILKPYVTDNRIEIEGKGINQRMTDNYANWLFFTNFKDAVPIHANGRRWSIFYSSIQNKQDLINLGMNDEYFIDFHRWLKQEDGYAIVTNWLLNYKIKEGDIPQRAPETSSHREALRLSRSPAEIIIEEAVQDGVPGFRGGFVSSLAIVKIMKSADFRRPTSDTLEMMLKGMGYHKIGRSPRPYPQENINFRADVYNKDPRADVNDYGPLQGYTDD